MFGVDTTEAIFIILDLVLIESLLSVDNAAVLATMVMDLPKKLRNKALQYGILGAYLFRGLCLFFASYLVQILWLKALGGIYLIFITYSHFAKSSSGDSSEVEEKVANRENWVFKLTKGAIGIFWSTVILVEVMDLAFSIDNIFAAVAITDNLYLICIGVFVGILAMRFVAQSFVQLMETYPFLENMAFMVIGILGLKLVISAGVDYFAPSDVREIVNGHKTDLVFSLVTAAFFFVPLVTSYLFNFPKNAKEIEN
ncbi:MAG: DUF475 domain-containing protein [Bacteroidetes bacterium]|nr:MAG: DUF475 domain-containing protein [Bacteroidota bacterium]